VAKIPVKVPDIGGAEGAEVIELLVAVGDEVELEQSLIVLESDKASMEIPSTAAGTIVEFLVKEGEELSEGDVIVVIESEAAQEVEAPVEALVEKTESNVDSQTTTDDTESKPAAEEHSQSAESTPAITTDQTVVVPDIGSDEPVDLIEISVAVGDQVAEGDSLVALESDKSSMEVPAPFGGEVIEILVTEGGTISQGEALMVLRTMASGVDEPEPEPEAEPEPEPSSAPVASAPEETTAGTVNKAPVRPPTEQPDRSESSVYAGPAVRKLAREFGLNLSKVTGSGPKGRLMKEDLHAFVQKSLSGGAVAATGGAGIPPIPDVDFSDFGEIRTESLTKMAKVTAANMQRSWLNVPHVTQFDDADITEMEVFRKGLKDEAEKRGTRLTPMPFLLKACAVALRDNPKFCSSLSGDGQSLIYKDYIHLGMAVDTPAGLLVPVIRDVDKKSIWDLADEVIEVAGKARDRKLRPDEMRGGCFTLSSLGGIGGRGFTPIVNAPEVGILGVSKADIHPVWNGEKFKPRQMLPLALSYDHRVINGGDAGRFLTQLVALLSDIRRLAL
jgi:pyruvate dehydrogenase E2 component (dihydrolipoamide acetyltransferase)